MDSDRLAQDDLSNTSVNPWISRRPNYSVETGGDWYQLLLSASLGFKSVHGANTAPTMEVLSKCKTIEPDMAGIGILRRDSKCTTRCDVGSDISDLYYEHKPYIGTVTANSSVLAFETGIWEPSMRRRARSSALLAAGMYAHGVSLEAATEVVSILASDDMDTEAISSTIVPASHLKREMIITTKANHRVFSRGTIQSSIIWSDSHLGIGGNTTNIAFDWGRVTALARYIAEANIQNCEKFRSVVETPGIPYQLVRNAWAYVSESDYHLTPNMFKNVPRIDVSRYNIPTMKGAFKGHEIDILLGLCNAGVDISKTIETDAFRGYRRLYDAAKGRKARRVGRSVIGADEIAQVDYVSNAYTPEDIFERLQVPDIVTKSLGRAIATRMEYNKETKKAYETYLEVKSDLTDLGKDFDENDENLLKELDRFIVLVMKKETWIMARVIAEDEIRRVFEQALVTDQIRQAIGHLSNMKYDIYQYPTHLEQESHLMRLALVASRNKVLKLVESAKDEVPVTAMSQKDVVSYELRESAEILVSLTDKSEELIHEIKTTVSNKMYSIYAQCCQHRRPIVKNLGARFSFAGYSLATFQSRVCCNKPSGYIDGADPLKCYVYKGALQLAEDFDYLVPRLSQPAYTHAKQISEELDSRKFAPFNITECVDFVIRVLDKVVGDLMIGKVYEVPEDLYDTFLAENLPPDSPQYDVSMMEEEERLARLQARFITQEQKRQRVEKTPLEACKETYPTPDMADEYARLNGYKDFEEAYLVLGIQAGYYEGSTFCYTAKIKRTTLNLQINESIDTSSDSGDDYVDVM